MINFDDLDVLAVSPLFAGIEKKSLDRLLACLDARWVQSEKGAYLLQVGDKPRLGVLLSGQAQIIREDFWGNRSVLAQIGPGELFGEAFCFAGVTSLPLSVQAQTATRQLFLAGEKLLNPCERPCPFHTQLIRQMIAVLAGKNVMLTGKIAHMSGKTTRDKLLSYLSAQADLAGSPAFTIPFDRQGLADYLAVDRSAMSAVLSQMRDQGLIAYRKNRFILLKESQD